MIFYEEPSVTLYQGHDLNILKELPAESVDMCMTSPPYWGLRTYKTEPQIWGDNNCEHEWGELIAGAGKNNDQTSGDKQRTNAGAIGRDDRPTSNFCLKCNAWRGELGLEPTIELYISHLIQIFNEVKRVLKKTGTCWVNIDDSYASSPPGNKGDNIRWQHGHKAESGMTDAIRRSTITDGLQAKSLCLIPQRFALAMVEQGWILRNDICWNKPNPMPESVKDRFTGSWEHLFFFVKSKKYWFEQQFEPQGDNTHSKGQLLRDTPEFQAKSIQADGKQAHKDWNKYTGETWLPLGRNKRDVWEIPTQGYPEAHFATFPEKLCEIPILAGCPQEGTVLDPFCGSGTALAVAKRLGRKGIGIDISPGYCKLTVKRIQGISIPMGLT